jgi:hypothetical protein
MYGMGIGYKYVQPEAQTSRQKRDIVDEHSLTSTFLRFKVFNPESHIESLQNIATKDHATDEIKHIFSPHRPKGEI